MVKRIGLCCLMFVLLFITMACTQEDEKAVPLSIHVDLDTVPANIDIDELTWEMITLIVTMSDGTYTTVKLDETMIDDIDREKVLDVGHHEITVTYLGLTTHMTLVIT